MIEHVLKNGMLIHKYVKPVEPASEKKEKFQIKKPEETENTIRIPVAPDCEVTATIPIDKDQGISALYCGKVKKIRTFIFDKKKKSWTMATARAWVKENHEKAEKAIPPFLKKADEKAILSAEKKEEPVVKQTTGEHMGRIHEEEEFDEESLAKSELVVDGKRIGIMKGKFWGKTGLTAQAYYYPVEEWTKEEAMAHCKAHKGIFFEPAPEKIKKDINDDQKVAKKLSEAQQKEYDAETVKIRESAKTAKYPHKFKSAKFTHLNGHPRCIICGDEEIEDEKGNQLPCEKPVTKFKIVKIDKKKQIVGGVIYEPQEVDTQGDYTDAVEIEKAMYGFMERYATDTKRIRINHEGKKYFFPILECFQAEQDTMKGGQRVQKGSWWLMIKVTHKRIWDRIEAGELEGFSMGGRAKA